MLSASIKGKYRHDDRFERESQMFVRFIVSRETATDAGDHGICVDQLSAYIAGHMCLVYENEVITSLRPDAHVLRRRSRGDSQANPK
jgi:hypothetical protein